MRYYATRLEDDLLKAEQEIERLRAENARLQDQAKLLKTQLTLQAGEIKAARAALAEQEKK